MNEGIAMLSNSIAYKGLIRHSDKDIKDMELKFNLGISMATEFPWLKELKNPDRKVTMVNTDNLLNKTLQK